MEQGFFKAFVKILQYVRALHNRCSLTKQQYKLSASTKPDLAGHQWLWSILVCPELVACAGRAPMALGCPVLPRASSRCCRTPRARGCQGIMGRGAGWRGGSVCSSVRSAGQASCRRAPAPQGTSLCCASSTSSRLQPSMVSSRLGPGSILQARVTLNGELHNRRVQHLQPAAASMVSLRLDPDSILQAHLTAHGEL